MKRFPWIICLLALISCEEVIEVDVPAEDPPRLIIDALIRVDEDADFFNAVVKVSLATSFFEPIPVTGLTDITIINLNRPTDMCANCLILKEKTPNSGIYEEIINAEFFMDGELILQLTHEDRLYFARTEYVQTVPIESVIQGDGKIISDDDQEVIVTYTDDGERDDYYLFDFDFAEYVASEDTFYQGQTFSFSYFYDRQFEPGTEIDISIMGIDQAFYNYMNLLIEQADGSFNIFSTPVATLRGNIFDVTDLDNIDVFDNVDQPEVFPLGYFAVVQEYRTKLVIE